MAISRARVRFVFIVTFQELKGRCLVVAFKVRGYCASTVGIDESAIRQYIQDQEQHQQNQEQDELNVT